MAKQYRVFGHTNVTVSCVVTFEDGENPSEEEILEKAQNEFGGVMAFAGNGGLDKLIGVSADDETIAADEDAEFDDFSEEV